METGKPKKASEALTASDEHVIITAGRDDAFGTAFPSVLDGTARTVSADGRFGFYLSFLQKLITANTSMNSIMVIEIISKSLIMTTPLSFVKEGESQAPSVSFLPEAEASSIAYHLGREVVKISYGFLTLYFTL